MLVNPQYSEVQRREVTTYLVSARETGTLHCSIQQAIDKAEPYSRIYIQYGTYFESISISQPIELIGDDITLPVIQGRGVCLSVVGDVECYVENIKIETKGAPSSNVTANINQVRGVQAAVRLVSGRPTLSKCEISSVFVGGTSSPTFINCLISGNVAGPGLVVAEDANGTFTKNTICNHMPHCVVVSSRGTPVFEENDIFQDPKTIDHYAKNAATGNLGGAVLVTREGTDCEWPISPIFRKNRIGDAVTIGVHLRETTFKALYQNAPHLPPDDCFESVERVTFQVDATCSPTVEENQLTGGHISLAFMPGSSGTFSSNLISHANLYGVALGPMSTPVVAFNTISQCTTGILVQRTNARLSHNTVQENHGTGLVVLVGPQDEFTLEGNSFVANNTGVTVQRALTALDNREKKIGPLSKLRKFVDTEKRKMEEYIEREKERERRERRASKPFHWCSQEKDTSEEGTTPRKDAGQDDCRAILKKNIVSHNTAVGILVLGARFTIKIIDQEITSNGMCGVLAAYGAAPILQGVSFVGGSVGLLSERTGCPIVRKCTFSGHTEAGVLVRDRGRGFFTDNVVSGFSKVGFLIDDGGNPVLEKNEFRGSQGTGIKVSHGGVGTIVGNIIESVGVGIGVTTMADPIVHFNKIDGCSEMGVYVFDNGIGTFTENIITGCTVGVGTNSGAECTIRANSIKDCTRYGVVMGEASYCILEKNSIAYNDRGNVVLEGDDCTPIVAHNNIDNSGGFGLRSADHSGGLVVNNRLSGNAFGGLSTVSGGATTFERNVCIQEKGPGIQVFEGGKGVFRFNIVEQGLGCGCELFSGSNALIEECTFRNNFASGIIIHPGAGGKVRKCVVFHNEKDGLVFLKGTAESTVKLDDLVIENNTGHGVQFCVGASGYLANCQFLGHAVGLLHNGTGHALVEKCSIRRNKIGAQIVGKGWSVTKDCVFSENTEADVEFADEGCGTVTSCSMTGGSKQCVRCTSMARGIVEKCTMSKALEAAVVVLSNAATEIVDNTVENSFVGIVAEAEAKAVVKGNVVRYNDKCNIWIKMGSETTFTKNKVLAATGNGVLHESRAGIFEDNVVSKNAGHGIVFDFQAPKESEVELSEMEPSPSAVFARRKSKGALLVNLPTAGTPKKTANKTEGAVCAKNVIEWNYGAGVMFTNYSIGTLSANSIMNNQGGGIIVSVGATPEISGKNRIARNKECGIVLADRSGPEIRHNIIEGNAPCNIHLLRGCLGNISKNEIVSGETNGIVCEQSSTVISENTISRHTEGSGIVLLSPNQHLLIEKNEINLNSVGVCCQMEFASATIVRNNFTGNALCAVRIGMNGCAFLQHNTFNEGGIAIMLKAEAKGSVVNNNFNGVTEAIQLNGEPIFTLCSGNQFTNNKIGVSFKKNKTYRLADNVFTDNREAGVLFDEGSSGEATKNLFRGIGRGVLAVGFCAPTVTNNKFVDCDKGVEMLNRAGGCIEKNMFEQCRYGICVSSTNASLRCTNNYFSECTVAGFCAEGSGCPTLTRSLFTGCQGEGGLVAGLLLRGNATGMYVENDFHLNKNGIVATDTAGGEVVRGLIHDNDDGILLVGSCHTLFVHCTLTSNHHAEIFSKEKSSAVVRNCLFQSKGGSAIIVKQGGGGVFSNSLFREYNHALVLEGAGSCNFSSNTVTECKNGILLTGQPSTSAIVSNNFILCPDGADSTGVVTNNGGAAEVCNNLIRGGEYGCLVNKFGGGKFHNNSIQDQVRAGIGVKGNGPAEFTHNWVFASERTGVMLSTTAHCVDVRIQSEKTTPGVLARAIAEAAIGGSGRGSVSVSRRESLMPTNFELPAHVNCVTFTENIFHRQNSGVAVVISVGETVWRKNHIFGAATGIVIDRDAASYFEGNVIYGNETRGCFLHSPSCCFTGNQFYNQQNLGAFDFDEGLGYILPRDNVQMNNSVCRIPRPPTTAPASDGEVGDGMKRAGLLSEAQAWALEVHVAELPRAGKTGCTLVPGSFEKRFPGVSPPTTASVTAESTAKKDKKFRSVAGAILTQKRLQPTKPSSSQQQARRPKGQQSPVTAAPSAKGRKGSETPK